MSRTHYEDPVEQVMFILGFKHDPKFDHILDAAKQGSNPGVLNAIDQVRIYGAIHANFIGWCSTMEKLHREFGAKLPSSLRNEVYEIVITEMDEGHYGGKWFPASDGPLEHWVNLGVYSAVFRRSGTETFWLPAPYFQLLSEFFA